MRFFAIFLLMYIIFIPTVAARDVLSLQQHASFAYKKMMQAKDEANDLTKVASRAENQLQRAKKQLKRAQQGSTDANTELKKASLQMEQASHTWQQASDTLARVWNESTVK